MADESVIPNHITTRNGVCQYIRRVPDDPRDAFPFPRIQTRLGTHDPRGAAGRVRRRAEPRC